MEAELQDQFQEDSTSIIILLNLTRYSHVFSCPIHYVSSVVISAC